MANVAQSYGHSTARVLWYSSSISSVVIYSACVHITLHSLSQPDGEMSYASYTHIPPTLVTTRLC